MYDILISLCSHLRELKLDCYPYTTNELLMALRLHTYITSLSLGACTLITDKGLAPLKGRKLLYKSHIKAHELKSEKGLFLTIF